MANTAGKLGTLKLRLSVQIEHASPPAELNHAQLRRWVKATIETTQPHLRQAELTFRFVGLAEAKALNQQYRGRDYATNVLTFNYDAAVAGAGALASDIAICTQVVKREARAQGKSFKDHLAHLVIHGTLHAQGWDHETSAQADAMEALEVMLLQRFRIQSPY